jgi:hypothetical protein
MECSHPSTTQIIADLRDPYDKVVENAVFIQKNDVGNFELLIGLSNRHSKHYVNIFAKNDKSQALFDYVTKFWIIGSNKLKSNDLIRFATVYNRDKINFKLISPLDFSLTANREYEFKYSIENVTEVAFVDAASVWVHLKLENNLWYLKHIFKVRGPLNLFAKPRNDSNFLSLCTYQIE